MTPVTASLCIFFHGPAHLLLLVLSSLIEDPWVSVPSIFWDWMMEYLQWIVLNNRMGQMWAEYCVCAHVCVCFPLLCTQMCDLSTHLLFLSWDSPALIILPFSSSLPWCQISTNINSYFLPRMCEQTCSLSLSFSSLLLSLSLLFFLPPSMCVSLSATPLSLLCPLLPPSFLLSHSPSLYHSLFFFPLFFKFFKSPVGK